MTIVTGIYQIKNVITGKIYIGSSVNIKNRWSIHKSELKNNKHHNHHLQRSWNKYGEDVFEFSVIESCSSDLLIQREQFYIDSLLPSYNILPKAGSQLGAKRSIDTKNKMSEYWTGRYSGEKNQMFGRRHTEEAKKSMGEKQRKRVVSKSVRERISSSLLSIYENKKHARLGNKDKDSLSIYLGVSSYVSKKYQYWMAKITVKGKRVYIGRFKDEISAAKAYDDYIKEHNLSYPLNFEGV